eukprot:252806_1
MENHVAKVYVHELQRLVEDPFMTDLTPEAIQVRQALFRLTHSKVHNNMIVTLLRHLKSIFHNIKSSKDFLLNDFEIDNLCNNKTDGSEISRFHARKYIMETLFAKSGRVKFWDNIEPHKAKLSLEKLLDANLSDRELMDTAHDIFYPKSPPEEDSKSDGNVPGKWRKDEKWLYCIFGKKT